MTQIRDMVDNREMYQCPSRAFFRFREKLVPVDGVTVPCINALAGLFFVSGRRNPSKGRGQSCCINALAGLFFVSGFSQRRFNEQKEKTVSMP